MSRKHVSLLLAAVVLALAPAAAALAAEPEAVCAECHGKDGASTESDVPVIGGASEQYLLDNIAAYRDQKRPCPESKFRAGDTKRPKTDMCKIAAKLSADDITKVAKHLAAEPFVKVKQPFDAAKAATGKKIHDQQCEKCHAEGGTSAEDDAGVLAGQWMPYLKETFAQYVSGARQQPEKMQVKFNALKAEEREALLHYYASQQ
jgi:sulfide dehydrogenase cytochrome subunit